MAEFFYYGVWEDSWNLVEELCRLRRFTFVHDEWYSDRVPVTFSALTPEVQELLASVG